MRYFVAAKPKAKIPSLHKIDAAHFKIAVREPPIDGRANEAVARALAEYLNVSPSDLRLVSGASSKNKVFDLIC